MELTSKIIEALKLPTKYILCIFAVSTVLLFMSKEFSEKMHLALFIDKYGLFIGIVSLSSGALLAIELIIYIYKFIRKKITYRNIKSYTIERVGKLDPAEKAILREFYIQEQNTIKLPVDHPVVAGLLNCGILKLVGKQGRMSLAGMLFSIKISELVHSQLTNDLLEWPINEPSLEEIDFLRNSRPDFMKSIYREDNLLNW